MKRKSRRTLNKKWRRTVRQHGSDIVIGLVTGIITNLLTDRLMPGAGQQRNQSRAR
jgi:hypothetical protein